mmetsp:Transcript_137741/g.440018  ORF Transcript_137741/g.440018 Transcript_137741/m.440018 type:complete len:304 (-) Transcript_137741:9-920(-)
MVVAAPDPELSAARHRRAVVVTSTDLHDVRGFTRCQDRVVGLLKIIYLLKFDLVSCVAPSKAAEVPLAGGVEVALLCEHDGMLSATSHLFDLLAQRHEFFHSRRRRRPIPAAVAEGTRSVPERSSPAPRPQVPALRDHSRVAGPEGGLRDERRPLLERHDARHLQVAFGSAQLVVLIRAVGVQPPVYHETRVRRAAGCQGDAPDVVEQQRLLRHLRVGLGAHHAGGAAPSPQAPVLRAIVGGRRRVGEAAAGGRQMASEACSHGRRSRSPNDATASHEPPADGAQHGCCTYGGPTGSRTGLLL